jgi:hypothetical protein
MTMITSSFTWRNVLPTHPAAVEFAAPTPTDLKKLADDIAANGLQNKVKIQWRNGERVLLDGRSRLDALERNGIAIDFDDTSIFEVVAESVDPVAYIIGANILRRHLTSKQKQDLLIQLIARTPEKSDRRIGREIGVDHKTVAKARARTWGNSPRPCRIDSKGRKQPAAKVRKPPHVVSAVSSAPQVVPVPIAPPLRVVSNGLDPEASAVARKAFYAATELSSVANDYAATRRASRQRHAGLTAALRRAVLAAESDDPAAEIVRAFRKFTALAATLGIHVDYIDVCARRGLQ